MSGPATGVVAALAGKRCLIVGGAGGVGRAAARRFLDEGARLVIADHDLAAGGQVVAELGGVERMTFVPCDATQSDQVDSLFTETIAALDGIDVLFHVAGGSGRRFGDGALHECTDDGWQATLELNLTSVFLTNRAALRHMLERGGGGAILNVASVLALAPAPQHFDTAAYTAAKGGIIALSRLAAARYAADGIRVNVLAPGLLDTPMAARAMQDEGIRRFLALKQPLTGGAGRPEDVATAAAFLCSDAARLITGAVLPVDGGWCVSSEG